MQAMQAMQEGRTDTQARRQSGGNARTRAHALVCVLTYSCTRAFGYSHASACPHALARMHTGEQSPSRVQDQQQHQLVTKLHAILDPFILRRLKSDVGAHPQMPTCERAHAYTQAHVCVHAHTHTLTQV